jgi:predicted glycoside hydrolase/deacetylase ChbG (UPF0249 family)
VPSVRRLIVNADDLGLSAGVNRGIIECATRGIVTSASVMVNTPGFDDAIARAGTDAPSLGLGLHLNLIVGTPVSRVPTLTDPATGRFWSFAVLLRRASFGQVLAADVARETEAQLGRLRHAGVHVTHLDSHRHTHIHAAIWPAVVDAAARAGVGIIRVPREPVGTNVGNWRATATKLLLGASRLLAGAHAPRQVDRFVGISMQGVPDFRAQVLHALDAVRPGTTELMVHPGYVDDTLREQDGYLAPREAEVRALTSPEVREMIAARGITLSTFADV